MLRKTFLIALIGGAFTVVAMAAGIDGKWVSERKMTRQGQERVMTTTLDLRSSGATLTGTVSMGSGQRQRSTDIQNGKIDGDAFSFTTVQKGRDGNEMKMSWKGTCTGDEMKGEIAAGDRPARPFTAKRQ